ncbi:MAG TPA: hypothetical protein VMT51_07845 [Dongiaceae bacterium]|nr:hypothetical protein [Dongiaceae bacterium]
MRALVSLLVACAVIAGIYYFSLKKAPVTDPGTAPTQAISLTGVRMDLNQIAQSERTFIATSNRCAPLDELATSGTMNIASNGRDGYVYEIRCGEGSAFTVTARHAPAPANSPIRYPNFAVDQTMQLSEVQ